jgi:hypothetical protein
VSVVFPGPISTIASAYALLGFTLGALRTLLIALIVACAAIGAAVCVAGEIETERR